jgi:AmiR/NasT family two-component response regulator
MTPRQVNLTQALADAATIGILQERNVREQTDVAGQLQGALNSRIVIEQAKGVVAEQQRVSMEEAFALLRAYSRNSRTALSDVAAAVIHRSLGSVDLRATPSRGRRSGEIRNPS